MLKTVKVITLSLGLFTTTTPAISHEDVAPVWSLTGEHIYFYSYRMDAAQLYRMNPDGSAQTKITSNQFHNWWMQPLSDDELLIVSDKEEDERFGGSNLFIYSISGDTHRPVTDLEPNTNHWAVAPSLSRNKTKLAYKRLPNGFNQPGGSIWLKNLRTNSETLLLENIDFEPRSFALMPKGDELLFAFKESLYKSNLDGSSATKILEMPEGEQPTFFDISISPDASQIAFSYTKSGFENTEIFKVNLDGSHLRQLTDNNAPDLSVNWSPDGKRFVFASYRDGEQGEIYVMNTDGSHQQNISNTGQPPADTE
ncbi:MAG: TolB family protein [Kordiimonas sp.]